jgi:sodium transport system permease protein
MNLRHIWIVFKKEVKDIIRDKRTVITSILVPMILIPGLNILVGGGAQKFVKDMSENITFALSKNSQTPPIQELVTTRMIKSNPNLKLVETSDPVSALQEDKVRFILEFEADYAEKLQSGKPFGIKILYFQSRDKSAGAVEVMTRAVNDFNRQVAIERIVALGGSPELLDPARVEAKDISPKKTGGNSFLMMILPLMISILMASAGIPAATDLIAGEKERNTFEPLLTTKPHRLSILIGKYLTVSLFSVVSVAAILAGIVIGYLINPNSLTMGQNQNIAFSVDILAMILAILSAVILGMTFAGIQIALSTYAHSFKEAQTYLSFLIFAAMIPTYATMFMQPSDIPVYMFLLPVLNTVAAFKMVLGGAINYAHLGMVIGSSLVYVCISLAIATALFKKEKYLFRN